jgi:lysozyme family protein
MAAPAQLIEHILKWEGAGGNNPNDQGGLTARGGVTYKTFLSLYTKLTGRPATMQNFSNLQRAEIILFINWFYNQATLNGTITSPKIAALLTEFAYGGQSGYNIFRSVLNKNFGKKLPATGPMDKQLRDAINSVNANALFNLCIAARAAYFKNKAATQSGQDTFLRGWLNRLNDFNKTFSGHAVGIGFIALAAFLIYKYL